MYVDAGELNKRISIYRHTAACDADGYPADAPELVRSCWAKFSRTSGTETVRADADFSDVKARFLIRYTTVPIDRKMIVRYADENYEIVYLNDYGDDHKYIELWCEKWSLGGKT